MEQGLRALRQLSAGLSNEAAVLKAASLVPVEPDEPQAGLGVWHDRNSFISPMKWPQRSLNTGNSKPEVECSDDS